MVECCPGVSVNLDVWICKWRDSGQVGVTNKYNFFAHLKGPIIDFCEGVFVSHRFQSSARRWSRRASPHHAVLAHLLDAGDQSDGGFVDGVLPFFPLTFIMFLSSPL